MAAIVHSNAGTILDQDASWSDAIRHVIQGGAQGSVRARHEQTARLQTGFIKAQCAGNQAVQVDPGTRTEDDAGRVVEIDTARALPLDVFQDAVDDGGVWASANNVVEQDRRGIRLANFDGGVLAYVEGLPVNDICLLIGLNIHHWLRGSPSIRIYSDLTSGRHITRGR